RSRYGTFKRARAFSPTVPTPTTPQSRRPRLPSSPATPQAPSGSSTGLHEVLDRRLRSLSGKAAHLVSHGGRGAGSHRGTASWLVTSGIPRSDVLSAVGCEGLQPETGTGWNPRGRW